MSRNLLILLAVVALVAIAFFAGREYEARQTPAENVEEALERTGDEIEEGLDEAGDSIDQALEEE